MRCAPSLTAAVVLAVISPAGFTEPAAGPVSDDFRAAVVQHGIGATDADHAGIWKAATPPEGSVRGEFDNNDPIGLSAGKRIWADCSINWVDPDSGRRYCFSSATSLVVFLERPHTYLASALKNWSGG
jgi:hypothetical protein